MSDPVILAATIVLSELGAWERRSATLGQSMERGASLERAIINLRGAIEAHEAIENWLSSDRGGRIL